MADAQQIEFAVKEARQMPLWSDDPIGYGMLP